MISLIRLIYSLGAARVAARAVRAAALPAVSCMIRNRRDYVSFGEFCPAIHSAIFVWQCDGGQVRLAVQERRDLVRRLQEAVLCALLELSAALLRVGGEYFRICDHHYYHPVRWYCVLFSSYRLLYFESEVYVL